MVTPGAQPPVNSMRVLHIDDDPDYLAITKMYLESFDPEMEVVSSLSPIESLPLIESMQFDCVVCDYLIPEMDGIELCRRVRKTSQVPFIIHTGRGSEEVASIAFDAGVDDYIRKEPGRSQYQVLANRVRQAVEKDRVERLYRSVLESSRDGIIIIQGTRIVYANQAMADIIGISSHEELLGTDVLEWVVDRDKRRLQSTALSRQQGDSPPSNYEVSFLRPDGEHRVVDISSSLINYMGRPASLGIVRDVSETARARERLASLHNCTIELASAESIEEVAKQTLDSIEEVFDFRWGDFSILEAGRVIPVHFKGVTYDKLEILNLDGPGVITRAARTGESQLVPDTRMDEDYLPTLIDGGITPLSELAVPIKSNGNVIGVINLESPALDRFSIDDQKLLEIFAQYVASAVIRIRNEGFLKASEEKYRALIESSLDAVTVSANNKIVYSNKRSLEILGYDEISEVKGMSILDLVHPEDKEIAREVFEKRSKGERGRINYTVRVQRKDGLYIHLESRTNGIEFEGQEAILSIARDITEHRRLEEELRESEERHRTLVELSPQGIMVIDSEGIIRSANSAVVKHHGYSSSEIVGKHFTELPYFDKSDLSQFREGFKSMLEGKGQLRYEYKLNHKDGTERWAVASFGVLKNQGRIDGFLTVINDITERKLMEESLRVNQERLHAFMESSPVSFAVFDSDLKYLVVNKHLLDLYGFAREDLIGKRMSEIHPDSKKSGREELYQEVIKTGEPIFIPEARSPSQLDDQVFSVWGFKVGEGMGLVSMNITENKKNEDELRESEERYRSLFDLSPYAIVISDLKGRITDVNDVVSQMAGYPKDELIGKHFSRLPMLNKRDIPRYLKIFSYFLRGNPTGPLEIQVQSRDGIPGILEMYVGFVDVGGEKVGIQAVFKDVTIQKKIEAELRRSEKRYRSLIELAPEGIMTINLKGVVTSINTAYTRLTGHSKNEIVGKHFTKLQTATSLKDMPKYIKMFTAMLRGKTPPLVEFDFKRKDGTLRRGETISQIVEVEPGMREVLTIHRDITERKRMEEELRTHSERLEERITERTSELKESEERFRNVIDNLPMGVHMYKIDANGDLRFIAANPTADKMDSIPSSAYIGKTLDEGFPNVDNEIKERFKKIAEKGGYWHEEDIRYQDDRISNATDNYIFQTAPGEMASIFRDITEQKQMEEEIRSLARFPGEDTNPVLRISGDGVLIYANAAAESVLSEWKTQVGMKAPEEWIRYVSAALEEGRLDVEIKISDRVLSMCLLSIENAGYVNVYSRDVTDEKRMEEDLLSTERLATAGRVAAMMGHDLRGPLVVVRNAVNIARENPEQTDRMLDMIDRNTGQAMDILEELRTRTRDEPVTLTSIEIRKFLDEATEDLFLPDEVELHIEIAEELSDIVLDKAKTLRALHNLIRNAIDAMPNGGIIKLVATRETDQFVISVSDTGTGVPDEIQKNLFKPFYTTKPGGMGLGLASTRRMVAVQGGTISFETKAGEGSTFSITLPLREKNTE